MPERQNASVKEKSHEQAKTALEPLSQNEAMTPTNESGPELLTAGPPPIQRSIDRLANGRTPAHRQATITALQRAYGNSYTGQVVQGYRKQTNDSASTPGANEQLATDSPTESTTPDQLARTPDDKAIIQRDDTVADAPKKLSVAEKMDKSANEWNYNFKDKDSATGKEVASKRDAGFNFAESLYNSAFAWANPRWYAKTWLDIRKLQKDVDKSTADKYGGSKVLGRISQVSELTQKFATVFGALGFTLGLIGVITSALGGSGAALIAIGSILGLIGAILHGAIVVMQSVLVAGNLIKMATNKGPASAAQRKQLFQDIFTGLTSLASAVFGGLGFSQAKVIGHGADAAYSVSKDIGDKTLGSLAGRGFSTAIGSAPKSLAKEGSELAGSVFQPAKPKDDAPKSGDKNQAQVVADIKEIAAFTQSEPDVLASEERSNEQEQRGSLQAFEQIDQTLKKSVKEVAKPKDDVQGADISMSEAIEILPSKAKESEQKIQSTDPTAKDDESGNESEIEKKDEQMTQVEQQLGLDPLPAKPEKPGFLKRLGKGAKNVGGKVVGFFKNSIGKRLKRAYAKIKAQLVGKALEITGVTKELGEVKQMSEVGKPAAIESIEQSVEGQQEALQIRQSGEKLKDVKEE